MSRILFEKAESGFRNVTGQVIEGIQNKLKESGSDPGEVDGIYGNDTKKALLSWQTNNALTSTGKVDVDTWKTLMSTDNLPSIRDRALQLTADFEGHGFRKIAGNFDGAGITWGIIGFTLKHGEIKKLIDKIHQQHPNILSTAFGELENKLLRILQLSMDEQLNWANGISLGTRKYRVLPEWEEAFDKLGNFKEVQALQLESVEKYWDKAERDINRFGLQTEAGFALCFDIAVQNGGIDFGTEERRVLRLFSEKTPSNEEEKRKIISNVVAENSNPRYVEDVRSRKLTIATGRGKVHGSKYNVSNWGISDFDI